MISRDGRRALLHADEVFEVKPLTAEVDRLLQMLASPQGVRLSEISRGFHDHFVLNIACQLERRNLLQHAQTFFRQPSSSPLEFYLQSAFAAEHSLASLAAQSVAIVGVGGVGGELARHLAASGIGALHLIDHDVVAVDNLNRQYLFNLSQVGQYKVEAASATLERVWPNLRIFTHRCRVTQPSDLAFLDGSKISGLLCAADTPLAVVVDATSRYAAEAGALFGMATLGLNLGMWGPLVPPDQHDIFCNWWKRNLSIDTVVPPLRAAFAPTNSLISAALARDFITALLGESPPSLMTRITMEFTGLSIRRRSLLEDSNESSHEG